MEAIEQFLEPIKEYINIAQNKDSKLNEVKKAIKKMQIYYGDDRPHDFGLYEKELNTLKLELFKNFSIEEYPELWV